VSAHDAQRALAMIQRAKAKGRASDVLLTRAGTPGGYDPETGTVEPGTPDETYRSIGAKFGYEQSDIDGTLIKQGDQQLYVPAKGFVRPESDERITVGDETYVIKTVEVVAPGDVDILYIIQIRGV